MQMVHDNVTVKLIDKPSLGTVTDEVLNRVKQTFCKPVLSVLESFWVSKINRVSHRLS